MTGDSLYDRISATVGTAIADKIFTAYAGRRLYIGAAPRCRRSQLVKLVGLEAAEQLAVQIGIGYFIIPLRFKCREAAEELLACGLSVTKVAARVGCSERTVWRYKADL